MKKLILLFIPLLFISCDNLNNNDDSAKEIAKLKEEIENLKTELAIQNESSEEKTVTISDIENLSDKLNEIEKLKKAIETLEDSETYESDEEIKTIKNDIEKLKKDIEALEDSETEESAKDIESIKNDIDKLKKALEALENSESEDSDEEIESIKNEINKVKKALEDLESSITEDSDEEIESINNSINQNKAQIESLEAELLILKEKLNALEEQQETNSPQNSSIPTEIWDPENISYKNYSGDDNFKLTYYSLTRKNGENGIIGKFKNEYDNTFGSANGFGTEYILFDFTFLNTGYYEATIKKVNYTETSGTNATKNLTVTENSYKQGRYKLSEYNDNYGIVYLYKNDSYDIFDSAYFYYMSGGTNTLVLVQAMYNNHKCFLP